jgi:hypothetical protein
VVRRVAPFLGVGLLHRAQVERLYQVADEPGQVILGTQSASEGDIKSIWSGS